MTPLVPGPACSDVDRDEPCPLSRSHEIDLALCADLEALADELPHLPTDAVLRKLTDRIQAASTRWADESRAVLFANEPAARAALVMDSVHAEDVIEAVWSHWRQPTPRGGALLGYMLRALFDGRRRAVALERLALGCGRCQSSERD